MTRRAHYVCGLCAAELLSRGGEEPEGGRLELGTACEVHRTVAATHRVMAEEGALCTDRCEADDDDDAPRALEDDDTPAVLEAPRSMRALAPFGPVTELAARFLVSWGHKSEGGKADTFMLDQAVRLARRLLEETGGR